MCLGTVSACPTIQILGKIKNPENRDFPINFPINSGSTTQWPVCASSSACSRFVIRKAEASSTKRRRQRRHRRTGLGDLKPVKNVNYSIHVSNTSTFKMSKLKS